MTAMRGSNREVLVNSWIGCGWCADGGCAFQQAQTMDRLVIDTRLGLNLYDSDQSIFSWECFKDVTDFSLATGLIWINR
jgi:hypothetical protein